MKINRDNYEIYFIDYFDGRLDETSIGDLRIFLLDNPDLEEEFNNYKQQSLPLESPLFESKEALKKDFKDFNLVEQNNFEEFCIAASEGDLDQKTLKKFNEYISIHPEKRKVFQIINELKLTPDQSILYAGKEALKKKQKIQFKRIVIYSLSVAAAVLFIVFLNFREKNNINNFISKENSIDRYSFLKKDIPAGFFIKKPIKVKEKGHSVVIKEKKGNSISNDSFTLNTFKEVGEKIKFEPLSPIQEELPNENLNKAELNKSLEGQEKAIDEIKPFYQNERLNLLSLAEAGIKGVNYLTESEIKFQKKVDDNGDITEYGIELHRFGFSTQRKK